MAADPFHNRIYMGAMQYHDYWDFNDMKSHGWFWTLPMAVDGYRKSYQPEATAPRNTNASAAVLAHAARFQRPYPMAHGLGVMVSHALARELPQSESVADFMAFYEGWLMDTYSVRGKGARIRAASHALSKKCLLGTDSTMGAWVMALRAPVIAVDVLNFQMNWPWPLPNRCHGPEAARELSNLHTFHFYGKVASDPRYWLQLHNATTVHGAKQRKLSEPRLRCRAAKDSLSAQGLLRLLASTAKLQVAAPGELAGGFLDQQAKVHPRNTHVMTEGQGQRVIIREKHERRSWWDDRDRLDPPDWIFCGIKCIGVGGPCQREWPGLRS